MWLQYPPLILDSLLWFSVCIQLHFSLSLSTSISLCFSFCLHSAPNLSISLSLSPSFYLSVSAEPSVSLHPSLSASNSIPHSRCTYISHSLSPRCIWLQIFPSLSLPRAATICLRPSLPPLESLRGCISFSRCLSLFVSVDRLVSRRAALWHGEMELVCSCSDGGTLQSG